MKPMIIKKINIILFIFIFSGCSISPGMHMETNSPFLDKSDYVYIPSLDKEIKVLEINSYIDNEFTSNYVYKIGIGDEIDIKVWGLAEIFPSESSSINYNVRRVDSNGNIYFPYVGYIRALDKSENQLRDDLSIALSEYFTDPQLDLSVGNFMSKHAYVLGEVVRPTKLNITNIPISLSDAIGLSYGIDNDRASASEVFIIRQQTESSEAMIFHANLRSPSEFIDAGKFYIQHNDIIYVNSNITTRWNRVIAQFFPFSSFLNSVDNLTED